MASDAADPTSTSSLPCDNLLGVWLMPSKILAILSSTSALVAHGNSFFNALRVSRTSHVLPLGRNTTPINQQTINPVLVVGLVGDLVRE